MGKCIGVFSVILLLSNCIGVDYEDDPIVGERIEVDQTQLALKASSTSEVTPVFYDQYGIQRTIAFSYSSSNPQVATVDQQGLITAVAVGQAFVTVSASSTELDIAVNVVANSTQVATVEIGLPSNQTSFGVGVMVSLLYFVKNIEGQILPGKPIEWFSENPSIATVENGIVTTTGMGMVDIHAKSEGVKSNIITLSVGQGRSGSFVSTGGYKAAGMTTLSVMDNKLILQLSNNFETSFALGTFIYLANSTTGSQVRASGLEIAQISTNGAKTFDITATSPGTGLLDYKYVIILCKPASLTFGYAELK